MKQPPFPVKLRNGDIAMVTFLGDCSRLFPVQGYLCNPPAPRTGATEEWRSDGRWCSDGHDHRWDIVEGLAEARESIAQHETTEVL